MSITAAEFQFVKELVQRQAAIVLDPGKEYLVESRLEPLARREGIGTVGALVARLRQVPHSKLHSQTVEALTTNETSFFRDQTPYDALLKTILPELAVKRRAEKRLNIWSAACSYGQEPYSIAMTLKELGSTFDGWTIRILATDLATSVLAKARQGVYNRLEVGRGLPPIMLWKYFNPVGQDYQVKPELRNMIEFQEFNLATSWPSMPTMDLVMVRNVMIYFDLQTKRNILGRVRGLLQPHSYLFLGTAESTNGIDDNYERVVVDRATCYRLIGR